MSRFSAGSRGSAPGGADRRFMRRALALAERGWGRVAPNPLVGAVATRAERIVGEGWHAEFGSEHAEVRALREAGREAEGGTVYVTLEPCSHSGKTPPCTRSLIDAGIARVVVACMDPHGEAGGGVEALRSAGVEVEVGLEARAATRQNAAFLWDQERERPFVTLKLALSLDGGIAAEEGQRTAITGEEARRYVHRLRAGHDAVLVGRRTVEVDDPLLTVREGPSPRRPPARVVLDSALRTDPEAAVVRTADDAPTLFVAGPAAEERRAELLRRRGVRVLRAAGARDGEGLDPEAVLGVLGEEGVRSVLVEGGGRVAASFLRRRCVERAHLLYAPVVLGPEAVAGFDGLEALPGSWEPDERRSLGRDTLLRLEAASLTRLLDAIAARRAADGLARERR